MSNTKNTQEDSADKKNKRGRRLLQKNRLNKLAKNKNLIESDDEEESFSMTKKDKIIEESADNDNIKLVRK